jgi:hypothetical protein
VPYPNAKAVNKTFEKERRTDKRHAKVFRYARYQEEYALRFGNRNSNNPWNEKILRLNKLTSNSSMLYQKPANSFCYHP